MVDFLLKFETKSTFLARKSFIKLKGGFPLIFPSAGTGTERTETNNKI